MVFSKKKPEKGPRYMKRFPIKSFAQDKTVEGLRCINKIKFKFVTLRFASFSVQLKYIVKIKNNFKLT